MLTLFIRRFDLITKKNIFNSFISLTFIFIVFYSFTLLLITIYDNKVSQYYEASYDYKITNFDEVKLEEIKSKEFVEDCYATRMISTEFKNGSKKEAVIINVSDEWDVNGVSQLGLKRAVKGTLDATRENGIILDVLTARKLNLDVGDSVDIYFKDVKCTYVIQMLIEPDASSVKGVGVILYNSYFVDAWQKAHSNMPIYSALYVKTNNEYEADQYFYNEYVNPRMEGRNSEEILSANYNSNIKKIWSIETAENEMEYTPPVTIILSIIGAAAIFIFIWRELSSKIIFLKKNLAIVSTMGMRPLHIVRYFIISSIIIQIPAILVAGIVVKKIIYDSFITNYYLTWELVWLADLIALIYVIIAAIIVSSGLIIKLKRTSISKILASE